jgi:diguanylate cyclase (GGDEF)-like protein
MLLIDNEVDYKEELILVVDDEKILRELVAEMLTNLGFQVHSVGTVKDALRELEEKEYTFLLTDIKMPDADGLEFLKQIKSDGTHNDLCAIAMTGYSNEFGYIEVIKAGASDFIGKPFGVEELEAKIRKAIIERNRIQKLRRLSITDALTGLFNRRHFYTKLEDELVRANRQKQNLGLILLDLDAFKQYNDSYGHVAGDNILKEFGQIINAKIRQGVDTGYRYGGDEFAVILINANASLSKTIAHRIQESVKNELKMNVSIGYAIICDEDERLTSEELVMKADKELYKQKGLRIKQVPEN